ncbi:MAG: amidohydrolase [Gemmatimonadota bacterium]
MAAVISGCGDRGSVRIQADLVLYNAVVHTADPGNPTAQAVAIGGGRILHVGSDSGALALAGPDSRVIDAGGRFVLPGFIDTHVHPVSAGIELGECNLNDAANQDDVRKIVRECAARDPGAEWIRGGGFQLPHFTGGAPSRKLLDSLVPDRPAFLSSADGHSAWVNSLALSAAGITRETPDPPNGRIEHDASGNPSGTLRESAQSLVSRHLPPRTQAVYDAGLRRALAEAAKYGITSWHEASASEQTAAAYARADSAGELTVRTLVALTVDTDRGVEQITHLDSLRRRYSSAGVRVAAAKIFADGVIEGHTGALLEPYLDRPGDSGILNLPPARLDSLVEALDGAGFKVHVHAIGDRAIRAALDAFARQHERDGGAGPRHLIAHVQLPDSADIPRFVSLGVIPSFQPLWAWRDSYIRDLTEPRLGPARSRWLYPIESVRKTGAMIAAGSDWSVSSLNPLEAIQVALTRQSPSDSTDPPFLPQERTNLEAMIQAYTTNAALAGDDEAETGSISVGKRGDLIVLSDDLRRMPPHRIGNVRVLLTFSGGREVFRDAVFPPGRR